MLFNRSLVNLSYLSPYFGFYGVKRHNPPIFPILAYPNDTIHFGTLMWVLFSAPIDDTSDIHIPAVFITQNHYRELRYLGMELGRAFLVKMTPDDMNW